MVCHNPLLVIGIPLSQACFGKNFFEYKELILTLAPFITQKQMIRMKSSTILLRCNCNVLQALNQRNGLNGLHGLNIVTTLVATLSYLPLSLNIVYGRLTTTLLSYILRKSKIQAVKETLVKIDELLKELQSRLQIAQN